MQFRITLLLGLCLFLFSGCDAGKDAADDMTAEASGESTDSSSESSDSSEMSSTTGDMAASAAGAITLSPENTKIEFVGTHTGDKPDPRHGEFASFKGSAEMAEGKLSSIQVEIDTASLTTEMDKLTQHLKSPDFFDVREHPTAMFKSTKIEGEAGSPTVTGELTLLGETKSISFPAEVSSDGSGLKLNSTFEIDRTEFGMNYSVEKVEKVVTMTISVEA